MRLECLGLSLSVHRFRWQSVRRGPLWFRMLRSSAALVGIGNGGVFMLTRLWLASKLLQTIERRGQRFREFDMVTNAPILS